MLLKLKTKLTDETAKVVAFFAFYFLYLWQIVDLRFVYHNGPNDALFPSFYVGWDFFLKFIEYPAGPIEYLSSFLSQFFYVGWLGALVSTCAAILVTLESRAIANNFEMKFPWWVHFVPSVIFLALYSLYIHHFALMLAVLAAFTCTHPYMKVCQKGIWNKLVMFIIICIVLYYAGGGAVMLFALFCAIYELCKGHIFQTISYILIASLISYITGVILFEVSVIDAFTNLTPFSWKLSYYGFPSQVLVLLYILYLYLPVAILAIKLLEKTKTSLSGKLSSTVSSDTRTDIDSSQKGEKENYKRLLSRIISSDLLYVLLIFGLLYNYNSKFKPFLSLGYNSYYKNWSKVLSAAQSCADSNVAACMANRALFHTGRLAYDMFKYPQHPDALMLTSLKYLYEYWERYDINIELGQINLAENDLINGVEKYGERPSFLKRLAFINMVKQNNGAARTYLKVLSRTLFDSGWANKYLNLLETDPNLSSDEQIQYFRQLAVKEDLTFVRTCLISEKILISPLIKNRQDRMAFEYLMAYYLLTRQLDKLVQNLDQLDDFGYPDIPRLYEEAVLIYMSETKKTVDLHERKISRETNERFRRFEQMLSRDSGNKDMTFDEIREDFGDSYMFYYVFGQPGVKKK